MSQSWRPARTRANVALPATATLAPPAWYLLFVVDTNGVPSHGVWVHLS